MDGERKRDTVAIIGAGAVGTTAAFALMHAGTAFGIVIINRD